MDVYSGNGVVRGRRGQQLKFTFRASRGMEGKFQLLPRAHAHPWHTAGRTHTKRHMHTHSTTHDQDQCVGQHCSESPCACTTGRGLAWCFHAVSQHAATGHAQGQSYLTHLAQGQMFQCSTAAKARRHTTRQLVVVEAQGLQLVEGAQIRHAAVQRVVRQIKFLLTRREWLVAWLSGDIGCL